MTRSDYGYKTTWTMPIGLVDTLIVTYPEQLGPVPRWPISLAMSAKVPSYMY